MSAFVTQTPGSSCDRYVHWLLIAGLFFAGYAIVLPWMHFNDSMETFNVLTSIEIARDGNWMLPTLWQRPRLEKPPLAQWLTALGIMAGGDIAFSARWVAMLVTCLSLIVVYEWGRLFHSVRAGIVSAVACGTCLLFVRFGKRAAYDGQLMFWDSLANLAFTWGLLRGQWLRGTIVGGGALGMAMLTKGPPALLHTLVPCAAWTAGTTLLPRIRPALAGWMQHPACRVPGLGRAARWLADAGPHPTHGAMPWRPAVAMFCGALVIAVGVGLPWVIAVLARVGGWRPVLNLWQAQVTLSLEREAGIRTTPLHGLLFFGLLMPWLPWVLGAASVARRERQYARAIGLLAALMLLPVIAHACMPIVRERYFLPMLAPAAVLAGIAYVSSMERSANPKGYERLALIVHYGSLLVLLAYPLLAIGDATDDGERLPGLGLLAALVLVTIGAAIVLPGILLQQRRLMALPVVTALAMLLYNGAYTWHQHGGRNASKEIAGELKRRYPDARLWGLRTKPPQRDFAIYLGRSFPVVGSVDQIPPGEQNMLFLCDDWKITPPAGSVPAMQFSSRGRAWTIWHLPPSPGAMIRTE